MSSVISSDQHDAEAQPLVALNLSDVEARAREIVERAKSEAKRILTEAVQRAREIERVARARGERAGYEAGVEKGREGGRTEARQAETERIQEQTSSVREALLEAVSHVENSRHELLADARDGLLELAVAIVERVCKERVQREDYSMRATLEEVIEATGRRESLLLKAHPKDAEAVQEFLGDVRGSLAEGEDSPIRLQADEGVHPGGCVAERVSGTVDAQIETQIRRIVSELAGTEPEESA